MRLCTSVTCKFHLVIKKKAYFYFPFTYFFSAEEAHLAMQTACEELKQKLNKTEADKQNLCLTMAAEIDDLNRTKTNLEERLIELIRSDLSLFSTVVRSIAGSLNVCRLVMFVCCLLLRVPLGSVCFELVLPGRAVLLLYLTLTGEISLELQDQGKKLL